MQRCAILLVAIGWLFPVVASAQQLSMPVVAPLEAVDPFGATVTKLGEDDLGRIAGREDTGTQVASATQRNTVANNSVVGNSVTGNIVIDGNAFSNLQGMAVINANSGNNVAINSAMNVNINLGTH